MSKILRLLFLCFMMSHPLLAQNMDINLLREININRNKNWDGTAKLISKTEGAISVLTPVSVVLVSAIERDGKLFQQGINMSFALVAASARTYILKRVVNRSRPLDTYPDIDALEVEHDYSFPSGHTTSAFVTATSLSLNLRKWYVIIPSYAWAGAVGYARLHQGVHYPSDVLAGAIIGAGSAWLTYKANKMIKSYYKGKKIAGMSF